MEDEEISGDFIVRNFLLIKQCPVIIIINNNILGLCMNIFLINNQKAVIKIIINDSLVGN